MTSSEHNMDATMLIYVCKDVEYLFDTSAFLELMNMCVPSKTCLMHPVPISKVVATVWYVNFMDTMLSLANHSFTSLCACVCEVHDYHKTRFLMFRCLLPVAVAELAPFPNPTMLICFYKIKSLSINNSWEPQAVKSEDAFFFSFS